MTNWKVVSENDRTVRLAGGDGQKASVSFAPGALTLNFEQPMTRADVETALGLDDQDDSDRRVSAAIDRICAAAKRRCETF